MNSETPPKQGIQPPEGIQPLEIPTTVGVDPRLASALNLPEDVTPDQVRGSLSYVLNLLDLDNKANLSDEDKERKKYLMGLGFDSTNAEEMLISYAIQVEAQLRPWAEAMVKIAQIVQTWREGSTEHDQDMVAFDEEEASRLEALNAIKNAAMGGK